MDWHSADSYTSAHSVDGSSGQSWRARLMPIGATASADRRASERSNARSAAGGASKHILRSHVALMHPRYHGAPDAKKKRSNISTSTNYLRTWLFIGPIILSGFAMGLACPGRSSCLSNPPSLAVKYPFRRENASRQMKRPLPLSRFARVSVCLRTQQWRRKPWCGSVRVRVCDYSRPCTERSECGSNGQPVSSTPWGLGRGRACRTGPRHVGRPTGIL